MRTLQNQETQAIAGGESTVVYFDLLPGVEVVGFEKVLVGYDTTKWTESTGFFSSNVYEIKTPVYTYLPIYNETVTYYYA